MRVAGGEWRGRPLKAPEGRDTRPTMDRTREAIGSMVASAFGLDLSRCSVLDAFAGSGAVGIELLSRGAAHGTFVETDKRALAALKGNLQALGADRAASVVVGAAETRARRRLPGAPFDVVYLDPPYALDPELSTSVLSALAETGQLSDDVLVVHQRDAAVAPLAVDGFEPYRTKKHGASCIDLLRRAVPQED